MLHDDLANNTSNIAVEYKKQNLIEGILHAPVMTAYTIILLTAVVIAMYVHVKKIKQKSLSLSVSIRGLYCLISIVTLVDNCD